MPNELGGPYLAVAVLCESILEENTGVTSLIRIIDRFTVNAGGDAPEIMPPINIQAKMFLGFKAGTAHETYNLRIIVESPTGKDTPLTSIPVLFEGLDRGNNIKVNLAFQAEQQGLYWFAVYLEEQLMTRIPLRIIYQRIVGQPVNQ